MVIVWILFSLVMGAIATVIAGNKGRSKILWFVLCFVFGFIPLIILAFLSNLKDEENKQLLANSKKCPKCAETIKKEAQICRFCSYEFTEEAAVQAISNKSE